MVVERIYISLEHGGSQQDCSCVEAKKGQGIVRDRNYGRNSYPGQNLTLVEAEEIERFCGDQARQLDFSLTRRNLVTRGVRLPDLVGKEFRIGSVRLLGVELCEPCAGLGNNLSSDRLSAKDVVRSWLGRGGLRADVVESGVINRGDRIQTVAQQAQLERR